MAYRRALFVLLIYFICFVSSQNEIEIEATNKTKTTNVTSQEIYTIVFDAGSTGTRIHIFTLTKDSDERNETRINFKSERFNEIKPGIGYYFKEPHKAGTSLVPLLDYSQTIVPENVRNETQLQLKATAGLRLLELNETEAILRSVRSTFERYAYKINKYSVSMLDATAEGTNAWITINFLLGNLHSSTKETVAVIDLGGGSTQLTFQVQQTDLYQKRFLVSTRYMNTKILLYTYSYLGNGLRSARKAILRTVPSAETNPLMMQHPCIPNDMTVNWTFEAITYYVNGSNSGDCYESVLSFVNENNIDKPKLFDEQEIYAVSHYYELAVLIDAIDAKYKAGKINVEDYLEYAKQICRESFRSSSKIKLTDEQRKLYLSRNPFMCMDLTYVTVLLNQGFGLRLNKKLNLVKKINGVEASWALGVALNAFAVQESDEKSIAIKHNVSLKIFIVISLLSFIHYLQSTSC